MFMPIGRSGFFLWRRTLLLEVKMRGFRVKWNVAFAECNITYLILNVVNEPVKFAFKGVSLG